MRENTNRYKYNYRQLVDVDNNPIHYGDLCEFRESGYNTIHTGEITDIGSDYDVNYVFINPTTRSHVSARKAVDIKVIKKSASKCCVSVLESTIDILTPRIKAMGFSVAEYPGGLLVNDKFIIAGSKKKWRIKGKGHWYPYTKLEDLKDFFKGGEFPKLPLKKIPDNSKQCLVCMKHKPFDKYYSETTAYCTQCWVKFRHYGENIDKMKQFVSWKVLDETIRKFRFQSKKAELVS